ncbi:MAG: 6-bladed beta-propeller [Rikenellaceae bacterium]|nr:6-bladed beta-propeller [Rikenellaceae bacterium]
MKSPIIFIIKHIAYLIIAIMLISCSSAKENENKVIDIAGALPDARVANLSEIAEDITYIPLLTTENGVVGEMNGVSKPMLFEKEIFILFDNNKVFKLFDKDGNFKKTIDHNGRGPQEYAFPFKAGYNCNTGRLFVSDAMGDVCEYTIDGDFVYRVKVPAETENRRIGSATFMSDGNYICSIGIMEELDGTSPADKSVLAYIYDKGSKTIGKILNRDTTSTSGKIRRQSMTINGKVQEVIMVSAKMMNTYPFHDKTRATVTDENVIYNLNEQYQLDSLYIFNLGEYAPTPETQSQMLNFDIDVITNIMTGLESDNQIFLWLNLRGLYKKYISPVTTGAGTVATTLVYGYFDKKKGETIIMKEPSEGMMGFKDDLKGGPPFWPKSITSDGKYMVGYIDAIKFITYAEDNDCPENIKKMAGNINENDNPIAILVKLK